MTGFGAFSAENDTLFVAVEIKSLNSKFLDLNLRLPKDFLDKEVEIRNYINQTIERGKVAFSIDVQNKVLVKPKVFVNKELLKLYFEDLQASAAYVGAESTELFKLALQMPKVIESDYATEENPEEWAFILSVIAQAVEKFNAFRIQEGKAIADKFREYIQVIDAQLQLVTEKDPQRVESIRNRIQTHLEEHLKSETIDKNRFEQEMIFYIEKLDISEEKVRLKNHLNYFLETLQSKDSNGKKLGFIAQEIGREINTIGSKANDSDIQRFVVQMKEELEKIKEQSLNIL
jgi:uncharacterized protein (TIGR00255 family)